VTTLVAIGASAGGPAALGSILSALPHDFPAAIVVIQHVDEAIAPGMAQWLGHQSALPVRLAADDDRVTAGTILIAGRNDHLALTARLRLAYTAEPRDCFYRPSVDVFFASVTRFWRGDAIGVLLTGMGRDGADGLKMLHVRGQYTIAQDEASSAIYGMPKAAAALGAVDAVLPLHRIAPRLVELVTRPRGAEVRRDG
jgi:two-component system response regulator WspF